MKKSGKSSVFYENANQPNELSPALAFMVHSEWEPIRIEAALPKPRFPAVPSDIIKEYYSAILYSVLRTLKVNRKPILAKEQPNKNKKKLITNFVVLFYLVDIFGLEKNRFISVFVCSFPLTNDICMVTAFFGRVAVSPSLSGVINYSMRVLHSYASRVKYMAF